MITRHSHILRLLVTASLAFCICNYSVAQVYSSGVDPASIKWSSVKTQNFRVIYPRGLDSLARVYGNELEKWRTPVGGSIGYLPGQQYRRQTPVILHTYNGVANGSVVWAPRRMELYTNMEAYEAMAMPWAKNLAIHESRHVSQMQFGRAGTMKVGHYLLGEMFTGALSGIYPNIAFDEGDAVVTETALTNAGRGRQADFLEWYRMSFDKGDYRSWYKWRFGSQKYYTPNHYAIGYMTVAGMRYTYDAADFTARYYQRLKYNPIRFLNFQKTVKEYSGKNFKKSFDDITASFQKVWEEENRHRPAPKSYVRLTDEASRFTTFNSPVYVGDDIYAIRRGITEASVLVRISPIGEQTVIRPFAGSTSRITYSPSQNRLYWSESIQDPRWDLAMTPSIRYMDLTNHKVRTFTTQGRLYNPSVSEDGTKLAAVDYPIEGGSSVVILDSDDGHFIDRIISPDGLQVIETAWRNGLIFVTGVSEEGYGLYQISGRSLVSVLGPISATIRNLVSTKDGLAFISDHSGVNDIYTLSDGKSLNQITASRYGASDFAVKGSRIVFANLDSDGKGLVIGHLSPVQTNLEFKAHTYAIADKLSSQEKALGTAETFGQAQFSAVKNYNKLSHLVHIHSWAPIYFNYDQIEKQSFDISSDTGGIGATAMFQNDLGTLYGTLGYNARITEGGLSDWKNSILLDMTYQGWYPVFNLSLDYNTRNYDQYYWRKNITSKYISYSVVGDEMDKPSISGTLKTYIPFSFNHGGWYRGVIPQLTYNFSNDKLNTGLQIIREIIDPESGESSSTEEYEYGKNVLMHSVTASLRSYIVRPTASSAIFPKIGIGVEMGYKSRIDVAKLFNSNIYFYSYGYLPGFIPQHGLKLTFMYQKHLGDGMFKENAVSTIPRGFEGTRLSSYLATNQDQQTKFTAEYAMPVLPVDWTFLCPLFYIRNFEVRPHFEILQMNEGMLYSAGSSFNVHLGNSVWLPYDTTFGISLGYNGGSAFNNLLDKVSLTRTYVDFHFSVDI